MKTLPGPSSRRAHRLYVQQQLLWQFGVQRGGHPSPSRTPEAGLWTLVVQLLLREAAGDDAAHRGGATEGGALRRSDERSDHLRCQGDGDAAAGEREQRRRKPRLLLILGENPSNQR